MKTPSVPLLLLLLLLLTAGTAAAQASAEPVPHTHGEMPRADTSKNDLEGAWERIFVRLILPDTTIQESFPEEPRKHKLLTATYFAFGEQSEDGEEAFGGGGRYTLDGDTYTETYEYHSSPRMNGRSVAFDTRVEGNLWYISGVVGRFTLEETWRRLE